MDRNAIAFPRWKIKSNSEQVQDDMSPKGSAVFKPISLDNSFGSRNVQFLEKCFLLTVLKRLVRPHSYEHI